MPRIDQSIFYRNAFQRHGVSAKGVAWSDENRQKRRFGALLRATGNLGNTTVVDAGCGFGDLYLYMRDQKRLPARYIGLDLIAQNVAVAKARTKQTVLRRDILKDPLPEAHWYLLSGTLNLLTRFETILALKRCCDASSMGVVFNLLEGKDKSQTYNYWLPQEIKKACESFGSVGIYKGYLDGDFTVKIKKC
jgi:SAM-dependent methyltransferase